MKTIELSAAIASAPVQENLKNFAGLDAQNALGLMTPERLAAVAGGKASFISGDRSIFGQALGTDAKSTAEYLYNNILPDDKNITFSFYIANNNAYMASGFISKGKLFGIINISCYIREQNKIFKIMNKELSEL